MQWQLIIADNKVFAALEGWAVWWVEWDGSVARSSNDSDITLPPSTLSLPSLMAIHVIWWPPLIVNSTSSLACKGSHSTALLLSRHPPSSLLLTMVFICLLAFSILVFFTSTILLIQLFSAPASCPKKHPLIFFVFRHFIRSRMSFVLNSKIMSRSNLMSVFEANQY